MSVSICFLPRQPFRNNGVELFNLLLFSPCVDLFVWLFFSSRRSIYMRHLYLSYIPDRPFLLSLNAHSVKPLSQASITNCSSSLTRYRYSDCAPESKGSQYQYLYCNSISMAVLTVVLPSATRANEATFSYSPCTPNEARFSRRSNYTIVAGSGSK